MGEVKNLPEVRFKGFSDVWVEHELGDLGKAKSGIGFPDCEQGGTAGLPFYKVSDMNNAGNEHEMKVANNYVSETQLNRQKWTAITEVPAIIFAKVGAAIMLNRKRLVRSKFLIDNNTMAYIFDDSWDENFGKSYFETINLPIYAQIGALPSYNAKDIESIEIKVTSEKVEQTQIGTFFKNLDNQITLKQRKLDKLVTLKKAMLEKIFPKDGADEPEIRFKGFSGSWNSELLDANADFAKGQGYSKSDLVEAGTPIVLYGRLYTKYESFISKVDTFVNAKPGSLFSKGCEVVVPASGETAEDIARASAILKEGVLLGGDLNIIYPNEKFTSVFLALSLSNGKVQKDLSKRAQGKSVVHVRNSDIKELEISFPSIEEQKAIGAYIAKLDDLISLQKTELTKLKQIKSSCLEKMFV